MSGICFKVIVSDWGPRELQVSEKRLQSANIVQNAIEVHTQCQLCSDRHLTYRAWGKVTQRVQPTAANQDQRLAARPKCAPKVRRISLWTLYTESSVCLPWLTPEQRNFFRQRDPLSENTGPQQQPLTQSTDFKGWVTRNARFLHRTVSLKFPATFTSCHTTLNLSRIKVPNLYALKTKLAESWFFFGRGGGAGRKVCHLRWEMWKMMAPTRNQVLKWQCTGKLHCIEI